MTKRVDNLTDDFELLPDARDGLTRLERIILHELSRAQAERDGAAVMSLMLYGRVAERIDVSARDFQQALRRLTGSGGVLSRHRTP